MSAYSGERRLNAYYCPDCGGYIVTEDVDEGVTPMFLACRVKGEPDETGNDCKGQMQSMMYPDRPWPKYDGYGNQIPTEPTWEWYRPNEAELDDMINAELRYHIERGGLLLRKKELA